MSYTFLQNYWWFIVSLLGAILVFLLFVQGANSVARSLGYTEEGRRIVYNSTGRKWEFTFTTLVTFGGAFFASFPLFYSTSFGGAYWLWMIILFTFVLQAVSYEFQNKIGNILGPKTFQFFLTLNGIVGPLLLGGAVATFFEGSNFIIAKDNMVDAAAITPIISRWANASHGLDVLLNPWVLVFGLAVMFLARTLGILYVMNNVADEDIRSRGSVRIIGTSVPFLVLFVAWLVHLLMKDGFAVGEGGAIVMEPFKYAQHAGKEHHNKAKHQHPGIEQHVESVGGICPTADDGSECAGINQIFLRHNEVAPFEEGGHGTSDKERAKHAVQHEEELDSLRTEEVTQFVLELIAHGLQHKGEQDEHPHPICAAETGAVEQRERSEEGSAEGNQRGERDFPLAARGVEHHPAAFGSASERTYQGVGSLNKHQEHKQSS